MLHLLTWLIKGLGFSSVKRGKRDSNEPSQLNSNAGKTPLTTSSMRDVVFMSTAQNSSTSGCMIYTADQRKEPRGGGRKEELTLTATFFPVTRSVAT